MANKTLFASPRQATPVADVTNLAGGRAYSLTDEAALCQYVVTSTLNGTFYASADAHLKTVQALVSKVKSETIAKAAVYGAETAKMKDLPAYMLAVLAARKENVLLRKSFFRVIKNVKMLCNFVQILRSGVTGRKSFGSFVKTLIREFLQSRNPDELFKQHFGHSQPSVEDIIKMVHPRPRTPVEQALYGYLIGKEVSRDNLPFIAQQFEAFKADNSQELPDLDYRSLTNCKLTSDHWKSIARNTPWNALRLNLNKFAREGVFADANTTKAIVNKLSDGEQVKKYNVFPYQLLTTLQNMDEAVPMSVKLALQDALDKAVDNVPSFGNDVAVLVDVSGSMQSPITGSRGDVTSKTKCVDVAALIASCVLRKNPDAWLVQFDTTARKLTLNPRDSVLTNARAIAANGGGTDVAAGLRFIRKQACKAKTVIIVSDNESWFSNHAFRYYGNGTDAQTEWQKYSTSDVPGARLVCIDLQPNTTTQVKDSDRVLNIGGFSDAVFDVINSFVNGGRDHFLDIVNKVKL